MANRDRDTEIWKDPWYRKLSLKHKCFYDFLCDNCDYAGFWKIDFETATFFIGESISIDDLTHLNGDRERFIITSDNKYIYIVNFIEFQYGDIENSNHAFHKKVKNRRDSLLDRVSNSLSNRLIGNREIIKGKEKGKQEREEVIIPEQLKVIFAAYLEMRKSIRKPATAHAQALILKELSRLAPGDYNTQQKILEQSIVGGWQGVFPLKQHDFGIQKSKSRDEQYQDWKAQRAIEDAEKKKEIDAASRVKRDGTGIQPMNDLISGMINEFA